MSLHWQAGSYPLDTWEAHGTFSCGMWDLVAWSGTAPTPLPWKESQPRQQWGVKGQALWIVQMWLDEPGGIWEESGSVEPLLL